MRRLDLEFFRRPGPPRWAGWLLLFAAAAFAGDLARTYVGLTGQVQDKEQRLESLNRGSGGDWVRVASMNPSQEELRFAADTIRRLATPWNALFVALEGAQTSEIALVSIEPDADTGNLVVTGNARDFPSAIRYVESLAREPTLKRVRLLRYETKSDSPGYPVRFSVTASWRNER